MRKHAQLTVLSNDGDSIVIEVTRGRLRGTITIDAFEDEIDIISWGNLTGTDTTYKVEEE